MIIYYLYKIFLKSMSKKLAGTLFIRNGIQFDYCYLEAIKCLKELCDHVFIVDAGSDDGTYETIFDFHDENTTIIHCVNEWQMIHGKEKLNHFTNIAIEAAEKAGYEYQINCQGDEIIHELSYKTIRTVIESGCEGFMCKRINLWKDCNHQLNVPQNRLPCSSEIIRLAKTKYRSCGDAESLDVPDVNQNYTNLIEIWHYGFVRKKEVMKSKIVNMQEAVFGIDHDPKLDQSEIFNPDLWFDPVKDLKLIKGEHPLIMQEWIQSRP